MAPPDLLPQLALGQLVVIQHLALLHPQGVVVEQQQGLLQTVEMVDLVVVVMALVELLATVEQAILPQNLLKVVMVRLLPQAKETTVAMEPRDRLLGVLLEVVAHLLLGITAHLLRVVTVVREQHHP